MIHIVKPASVAARHVILPVTSFTSDLQFKQQNSVLSEKYMTHKFRYHVCIIAHSSRYLLTPRGYSIQTIQCRSRTLSGSNSVHCQFSQSGLITSYHMLAARDFGTVTHSLPIM